MTLARKPKPAWDRHAILAEIKRRGMTLLKLAEDNGLERSACSVALLRPHTAGETAIATFLDVPLSELWPSRYPHGSSPASKPESPLAASPKREAV